MKNFKTAKIALSALFFMLTGYCFASSYSLQIIQHDKCSIGVNPLSYEVEGNIMDYFFDNGNVITNTPAAAVKDSSFDEEIITKAIFQAIDGMCEVLISVTLEYDDVERTRDFGDFTNLDKIEWFIMDIGTEKILADGSLTNTLKNDNLRDKSKSIKNFTNTLSKDIVSCLEY